MKKIVLGLFLAFIGLFLVSCAEKTEPTKQETKVEEPKTIDYTNTEVSLKVGETFTFDIKEKVGSLVTNKDVVELNGLTLKALKAGSATVTFYLIDDTSVRVVITITVTEDEKTPTPTPQPTPTPTPVVNTYTISYDLDGGECDTLVEEFEEGKFPTLSTPTKEGFNFLGWFEGETKVERISENRNYNLKASWKEKVILPESIEIILSVDDDIIYTDTECYLTCVVYPEGASQEVTWKAMNKSKATLDENNMVVVSNGNQATFVCTSAVDEDVKASITLNVRNYMNPYNFLDSLVVKSDEIVAQDIRAYDSTAGYETYLLGSVIKYLVEDLVVDSESYMLPENAFNRPGKTAEAGAFQLRYITVHDVGGTGDAQANARYCNNPGGREVSWHYTVGNDGVYQQIPDDELAWHAGDGTWDPVEFYDTGVIAEKDEPATVTVNQTNGKYMINGVESKIMAPKNANGGIVSNDRLPYTGINTYVDTNKNSDTYMHYYISKTYWNTTYNTLCSRGGNMTTIGIESTVNKGSNIFYTWELLAKLVGYRLLAGHNLLPRDVRQHNSWSGKNCPQTMRQADRWPTFMEYVTNEYIMATKFYQFKIEFESDSEYLKSNGMIKTLPVEPTEVSFKVKFYSEKENVNIEKTYTVTLPAKSTVKNMA